MPSRNGKWYGSSWIRPERRLAIYHRDGFTCAWCGASSPLCLDHLWRPVEGTYDHRSSSLVTACKACNDRRGGLALAAWLRRLRGEARDLGAIIRELRRRVRLPVDRQRGRELLSDPKVVRARRAAGRVFRSTDWPTLKEDACIPF